MAATTFQMYTDLIGVSTPRLVLVGLLLLAMSGVTSGATLSSPVSGTAASTSIATSISSSPSSGSGTPTMMTTMMSTSKAPMPTTTPISSTTTTMAASPNSGSMMMSTTKTYPATTMPMSGSPNTGSGNTTMMMTSNSTGSMANMTVTTMGMISCPVFSCNCSECKAMYASQNTTQCASGEWCQLLKTDAMYYTANCSAPCSSGCANATDVNCAVACCNSTGCLDDTFASLMMTTTSVAVAPTTASVTTAMTVAPTGQATTTKSQGNKCQKGTCTGATCYSSFSNTLETCSSTQLQCQLSKQTVNGNTQWTAGCTTTCSDQEPCKGATSPPCHLECCDAGAVSCLWLNGTLNHVSSDAAGTRLRSGWTTAAMCLLLALGLLL
ncbi:mucin-5AC [Syngnathus acus]|uniref:mucin-5AC n=1 Tax=Syngnathus acus TaxID=161584 RepID=UPI00188621DA|nr:mucin-5AC [Syngnathus acus]